MTSVADSRLLLPAPFPSLVLEPERVGRLVRDVVGQRGVGLGGGQAVDHVAREDHCAVVAGIVVGDVRPGGLAVEAFVVPDVHAERRIGPSSAQDVRVPLPVGIRARLQLGDDRISVVVVAGGVQGGHHLDRDVERGVIALRELDDRVLQVGVILGVGGAVVVVIRIDHAAHAGELKIVVPGQHVGIAVGRKTRSLYAAAAEVVLQLIDQKVEPAGRQVVAEIDVQDAGEQHAVFEPLAGMPDGTTQD